MAKDLTGHPQGVKKKNEDSRRRAEGINSQKMRWRERRDKKGGS